MNGMLLNLVHIQCTYGVCVLPSILCKSCKWCPVNLFLRTLLQTILLTTHVTYAFFLFQTQLPPHEPKLKTGKDLQAMEAKLERYRWERNLARNELQTLQKQLEQSKMEAEKCSGLTAQYEGRIQELEAIVADARRKHEEQLDKLKKEFEGVLTTQRTEGYNAHARTFGEDRSSSVQQVEATYQAQLYQKEKELRDKEMDFTRRQDHYLAQISQLEAARDVATKREEEARREVERMKMEHHSQLHRLQVQHAQPGVSELNT